MVAWEHTRTSPTIAKAAIALEVAAEVARGQTRQVDLYRQMDAQGCRIPETLCHRLQPPLAETVAWGLLELVETGMR